MADSKGSLRNALFADGGGKATYQSIDFFHMIKPMLGKILKATAGFGSLVTVPHTIFFNGQFHNDTVKYHLILNDDRGREVWLSGCNCGYGGEGPSGTHELLQEVGLLSSDIDFSDSPVCTYDRIEWVLNPDGTVTVNAQNEHNATYAPKPHALKRIYAWLRAQ